MNKNDSERTFFFQPDKESRWWEFRKMDKREYGYTAVVGLLAGFIFSQYGGSVVLEVVGGALSLVGWISALIWVIMRIKERRGKK